LVLALSNGSAAQAAKEPAMARAVKLEIFGLFGSTFANISFACSYVENILRFIAIPLTTVGTPPAHKAVTPSSAVIL